MHKKVMIQGTASSVGKSMVTTAICRILASDGYSVSPFKPQNMSSRSFVTEDGREMGVGQALQAMAAKKTASADMNPILLKPGPNSQALIFIQGRPTDEMDSLEYRSFRGSLKPLIQESYDRVSSSCDYMVIEGAGSCAELNLLEDDISNMATAELLGAPVILVADIDKGGVFASIYGTIMLQEEKNRHRIKGVIINKFRGKRELLQSGIEKIEELTKVPVIGVLPYLDLNLEEEDGGAKGTLSFENTPQLEAEFDKLEQIFRENMDMEKFYRTFE